MGLLARLHDTGGMRPYTINVLNAVLLSATASSRAMAFSLIMVMVLFPSSVVLRVGPGDFWGGEGAPGPTMM